MDSTSSVPPAPAAPSGSPLDPLGALGGGWRAFVANPWITLGVLLVLMAVLVVGQLIPYLNVLFSFLVAPALYAGGAWFFLRGVRGENPPFECAFEGFQRWASVTGAGLVVMAVPLLVAVPLAVSLAGGVGLAALLGARPDHLPDLSAAALVPFFLMLAAAGPLLLWWTARTTLVFFVLMEPDRPAAMEALRRSFALTKGSVWRMIGLFLLMIPVALLGLLAFCVGVVPAAAVQYYAFAHAYEQLRARAR